MTINFSEIQNLIKNSGKVKFCLAGHFITLDLENQHERAYAARMLLNVRHPQADIDQFIFNRFIRKSDTVLDAGANIGVTALECLNSGAQKVIAVEGLPALHERLAELSSTEIIAIKGAISRAKGCSRMFISSAHNQGSSLYPEMIEIFPSVFGKDPKTVEVSLVTIDELCQNYGNFDVWKLDIEGAETDAVRGAEKTLKKNPPRVIIAELYDRFYAEFYSVIESTHPYAYRAFITRDRYELELCPPVLEFRNDVYQTSPMYVFLQRPLNLI